MGRELAAWLMKPAVQILVSPPIDSGDTGITSVRWTTNRTGHGRHGSVLVAPGSYEYLHRSYLPW